MKTNGKRLRAGVLAGMLAVAMVLTGTFAWRSMSQRTINKFMDSRNPGGRVHDDFSYNEIAKNKDVYAENFTDETDGAPVFARIKLLEYMEIGEDAGVNLTAKDRKVDPVLWGDRTYASVNDTSTWKVFDPTDPDDPFRKYWDWTFGGSTNYLPTFNKNKDSLSVDVNGTYEGLNGLFDDLDPYSDYEPRTLGDTVTKDAYYDADPDDDDEYKAGVSIAPGAGGTEGVNYNKKSEEHKVKATLNSLGIWTMSQWKAAGCPVCNRWIYDDSAEGGGWFYWPKPVMPQSATGLLLNKVDQRMTAGGKSYYAIEVVGEFATAGQWGNRNADKQADRGFYLNGFSEDAKALLDQATSVEVGKDDKWYLAKGNGVYQPIQDEAGTLGGLVCAGEDKLIGTADDRKSGVIYVEGGITLDGADYGAYFLEPTETENYYRGTTPTGSLGTVEDTRIWVISGEFPTGTLTTRPVTAVTVQAKDRASQVKAGAGTTLQFLPTVSVAEGVTDTSVAWSVAGNTDVNTTISEAGVLTLGAAEAADTKLTITATSQLDRRVSDSWTVKVVNDITTTLDETEYYVLKIDSENNRALILTKSLSIFRRVDPINITKWRRSELNYWLNNTGTEGYLGQNPDLNGCAIETTILTRETNTKDLWEENDCKVFLLTQADIYGKQDARYGEDTSIVYHDAYPNDYTAGEMLEAPSDGWIPVKVNDGNPWWWYLRSPSANPAGESTGIVLADGKTYASKREDPFGGVRPAAWITLNGVRVSTVDDSAGVLPGGSLQMKAFVVEDMRKAADQSVTWSVSGGASGTTIDDSGLLTVAAGETSGKTLTVTATAADGSVGTMEIKVVSKTVDVSSGTVTLDGIEFYVMKQEGDKALLLSKYALERTNMDQSRRPWDQSELRIYMNRTDVGGWLYGKPEIQAAVEETTVKTRVGNTTDQWTSCQCEIFLLTQADIYGTQNYFSVENNRYYEPETTNANDYTAGEKLAAPSGGWGATTADGVKVSYTLRSPRNYQPSDQGCGIVEGNNGNLSIVVRDRTDQYMRPALWVRTS